MSKINVCIIYPTDPKGNKIGGVETFLKGFIKYCPDNFIIDFVGITTDPNTSPLRKWTKIKIYNRHINFFPLLYEKNENKKSIIPLSLRFVFHLKFSRLDFSGKILFFNRIEPIILFRNNLNHKFVVIHTDINKLKTISEITWSKIPWIYFYFERIIFKYTSKIYVVSQNSMKFYLNKYNYQKNKFSYIPTWVDTDIFYPLNGNHQHKLKKTIELKSRVTNRDKLLLFVGRLQEVKEPFRVVDCFKNYRYTNPTSKLAIVGEGNLKAKLQNYANKLDLKDDVLFLGYLNQERLAKIYRASDILLLTSKFEGMPRCVLESLACGTPVVATDVGEIPKIITKGKSGEIVRIYSSKIFADMIKKIFRSKTTYSVQNCIDSINSYTPQKVLGLVYSDIEHLSSLDVIHN